MKTPPLLIFALAALAASADASITPTLNAHRTSGVAPLFVFFDAEGTTATGSAFPFNELDFQWDFNDPLSDRPTAAGGTAGHVFERPGTYLVTLTVRSPFDLTAPATTVQRSITVEDPETVFMPPNGRTVCVSSSGDFSGCPSPNAADHMTSIPDPDTFANPNIRILLRRGDQWTLDQQIDIRRSGPGHLGAFGPRQAPDARGICANAPRVVSNHAGVGILLPESGSAEDWRITDLDLDGNGQNGPTAVRARGRRDLLIMRNNSHGFRGGFDVYLGNTAGDGVGVVENWSHGHIDSTNNTIVSYAWANRLAYIGNLFTDGTSHLIRVQVSHKAFIHGNTLLVPKLNTSALTIRGEEVPGTGGDFTEFVVVSNNRFHGPTAADPGSGSTSAEYHKVRDIVFDSNLFERNTALPSASRLQLRGARITVRNNVFHGDTAINFVVVGSTWGPGSAATDVNIHNNVQYNVGDTNDVYFVNAVGQTHAARITVKNNIQVAAGLAPNQHASLYSFGSRSGAGLDADLLSALTSNNNYSITNLGTRWMAVFGTKADRLDLAQFQSQFGQDLESAANVAPLFVDPANNDFRLQAGSPLVDVGGFVPLLRDSQGGVRPFDGDGNGLSRWDVGPTEYGSTPTIPPAIQTQPVSTTTTAGGATVFSVSASGVGTLSYQWQHNGVNIPGANTATLTLLSTQAYHAGEYTCLVSSSNGTFVVSSAATLGVNPPAPSTARVQNLSTRALCQTGSNILIPGFYISGAGQKRLLLRAVGPELEPFGITGFLPNPQVRLMRALAGGGSEEVAYNDDWEQNANAAEIDLVTPAVAGLTLASGSLSSALLVDLAAGGYTLLTSGHGNETGIALAEIYEVTGPTDTAQLVNISNRGFVGTAGNVMIPGFVVSSAGARTFLIRAVGPQLGLPPFGVPGVLADPNFEIYKSRTPLNGSDLILTCNNWGENGDASLISGTAAGVFAFPLNSGSADAAMVVTLPPGQYTVVASGVNNTTGVALVEVYLVP